METYGYIYITTNKINEKRYIGQHKSIDFDFKYFGSGKLLKLAIKKYGIENFICFPLAWAWNENELNQLEIDYISHYKPEYNLSTGGESGSRGAIFSEETRKKMSESQKGNTALLGYKHTEEIKKIIGEKNKGRIKSEEEIKKLSIARKLYWKRKKEAA
jgi:group I intron endonuclease